MIDLNPIGSEPEDKIITAQRVCPVCGHPTVEERCKVVCNSETCRGLIIENCSGS